MTDDELRAAIKQQMGELLNAQLHEVGRACEDALVQIEAVRIVLDEQIRVDREAS